MYISEVLICIQVSAQEAQVRVRLIINKVLRRASNYFANWKCW